MLDDIEFLDDATRPEGPKLEGLTEEQRLPGMHLKMIHNHLRENMHVLRTLLDEAARGEVPPEEVEARTSDLTMITNYRRFGALCGRHCQIVEMHHSIEDAAIFPELSTKSQALLRVTQRLIDEHKIVHELLVRLVNALGDLARDSNPETFAAAREVYVALERVLNSHLNYEEDSIGDALGYYGVGV
ncbi:hypothetical protein GCM10007989_27370 [Devosia pacifica]|uniref:Hemerythrin-like domain-containing protein n=1 Tax=Devosia pacifica TaxID=1335967 RepID=A0A918VUH8_9HYPH|nr:hemerythrin domain-containing protein [Devosia pacifica]GHA30195.1 hypothetical protein GCM10007989_27370 [Devosia pacifica]